MKLGRGVYCPQCRGCKDRTEHNECRKTCFSYNVAVAREKNRQKKREKIRESRASDKEYEAYHADAVVRMKHRDWHRDYRKRGMQ